MDLALCMSLKGGAVLEDREDQAELDDDEVRDAVYSAMSRLGSVRIWDTVTLSPAEIASEQRPDIIFNLAEGVYGTAREAQVPALFEWLQWRYVGSDPVTLAIALDKWYTKCVLQSAGIPTPRARVAQRVCQDILNDLRLPLIIKPVAEGSGKGVFEGAVVESFEDLSSKVNAARLRYKQPILIEEFLLGREFTVAVIGNNARWEVLPIVEINFEAMRTTRYPIFGYEAKWVWPSPDDMSCPANISDDLRQALESTAIATCDALRIRDWGRVDIRLDENGTANVLDVNALPGILPGNGDISCFTLAAYAAGMDFDQMIARIINTAIERYDSAWFLPHKSSAKSG